jgi:hypothetical protein
MCEYNARVQWLTSTVDEAAIESTVGGRVQARSNEGSADYLFGVVENKHALFRLWKIRIPMAKTGLASNRTVPLDRPGRIRLHQGVQLVEFPIKFRIHVEHCPSVLQPKRFAMGLPLRCYCCHLVVGVPWQCQALALFDSKQGELCCKFKLGGVEEAVRLAAMDVHFMPNGFPAMGRKCCWYRKLYRPSASGCNRVACSCL